MEWTIAKNKCVKISSSQLKIHFTHRNARGRNHGLTISKEAFLKMEDVTITPGFRLMLEPRVFLSNYGRDIKLTKYCYSRDNQCCDGGFFLFTEEEWQTFWTKGRLGIQAKLNQ